MSDEKMTVALREKIRAEFADKVKQMGVSTRVLAKEFGSDQAALCRWINGNTPHDRVARKMLGFNFESKKLKSAIERGHAVRIKWLATAIAKIRAASPEELEEAKALLGGS